MESLIKLKLNYLKTSHFGSSELQRLCLLDDWLPVLGGTTQRWTPDSVSSRNPEAFPDASWGLILARRLKVSLEGVSGCWVCASKRGEGREQNMEGFWRDLVSKKSGGKISPYKRGTNICC